MMDIRSARQEEAQAIAMLDAKAYARAPREGHFQCNDNEPGASGRSLLVLWEGRELRAFIDYHQVVDEVTVHNIAVDPENRGRGLAGVLLKEALERMRAHGALRCLLEVRASNHVALALYQSYGFRVDGERKDYYPAGSARESALLMSLEL